MSAVPQPKKPSTTETISTRSVKPAETSGDEPITFPRASSSEKKYKKLTIPDTELSRREIEIAGRKIPSQKNRK